MPSRENDQFVDAVKPALESLLSDLQRTTEVLKRANERNVREQSTQREYYREEHRYGSGTDGDIDPIYQEQNVQPSSRGHSYQSSQSQHQHTYHQSPPPPPKREHQREVIRHNQETKYSPKDPSQLDSMLGNLKVDMDKHGVHTIPKGDCASCGKSIIGQVVIALGKMWHPEHYVCCHCGDQIGHKNFFERAGKAYCENDYHDLFSPRCAYCNGPIKDVNFLSPKFHFKRCVNALGKTFHPEHFVCTECGREFGDGGFHEKDGHAYCRTDFFKMFAPKCHGCNKPIQAKFITALGTHWHPECFICQDCRRPFANGAFFEHNGMPVCEQHYHEKRGSLCHECKKPISGRCVSAMGKKFHPEHFCCSYCNRQLCRGTFKEINSRPMCHKCFDKIHNST